MLLLSALAKIISNSLLNGFSIVFHFLPSHPSPSNSLLLSEAKDRYLRHLEALNRSQETLRGYGIILVLLENFFSQKNNGPAFLTDIDYDDLDEFIYYMAEERGWQVNSIQKCHYCLRSFFGYCYRKRYYSEDLSRYMEPVRGERKERAYLDPADVDRLLAAIDHPTVRLVVRTMYYSGMRIGEAVTLKLEDVDFGRNLFHIRKTKGKSDRVVPISSKLAEHLKLYLEKERPDVASPWFFALKKTGQISKVYVNLVMKESQQRLGWKNPITAHALRHSFASNLIQQNVNLVHVQKLLGHSDLRTTSVYTSAKTDDLALSVEKL